MNQVSNFLTSPWESIQNLWAQSGKIASGPKIAPPPKSSPLKQATLIQSPGHSQMPSFYQSLLDGHYSVAQSVFGFVEAASAPKLNLPPRPAHAMTGSQFWDAVQSMSRPEREAAIQREISLGNVPEHLRELQAIELQAKSPAGETLKATAHVTPDYLAIGSSDDYVLVPMSPLTAQAIADQTGTTLPTRKLVDAIYQQAEIKLSPSPQTPGPQMMSTPYYEQHDNTIRQQRQRAGAQNGDLIAGHKKDVVITNRLDNKPKSVAIYGWHQRNGKNIQPLSTLHENSYADYSHGVRLVGPTLEINGQTYQTQDVLKNPEFAALLSDEGVIRNPRATR